MIYTERLVHAIDDVVIMAKNTIGSDLEALKIHYNILKGMLDAGTEVNPKDVEEAIDAFEAHDPEYLAEMYRSFSKAMTDEGLVPLPHWGEFIAKVESGFYGTPEKSNP